MTTRVIITGDRHWKSTLLAGRILDRLRAKYGKDLVIIHGDADGIDRSFARIAQAMMITQERFPAAWDELGNAAGPARNQEMVDAGAKFVIACHKDIAWSRGTKDCARRAMAAEIRVYLIDSETAEPRQLTASDLSPNRAVDALHRNTKVR